MVTRPARAFALACLSTNERLLLSVWICAVAAVTASAMDEMADWTFAAAVLLSTAVEAELSEALVASDGTSVNGIRK